MPLYQIRCTECGRQDEIFLKLSEYQNLPVCCETMMVRVITPINVMADIQPYKSMVTGEMITSRSQHKAHLKQHNCFEIGNEKIPERKPHVPTDREVQARRNQIYQIMDAKGL